jgi:hypothetical protein
MVWARRAAIVGLAGFALWLLPGCRRAPGHDGTPAARTFFASGERASKAGKHADAAAAYRQAIDTDHDFIDAHQKYIDSTRRSQPDAARAIAGLRQQYEEWASAEPRRAAYRWALGFLADDAATADRSYTEALRLDPRLGRAHVQLAKNADLRGDWAAQREHLKAAVDTNPANSQFLLQYAAALKRSEPQRARDLTLSVAQRFPGTPDAAHALFDLAGDSSGAERRAYFDRLRNEYPAEKFDYGYSAMYTLYGELTSAAEALALARDQAKRLPGNKTWATRLAQQEAMARAETLIGERKPGDALAAIDAIARPSGRHGSTWVLLKAEAVAGTGHVDRAYDTVVDSLARGPDDRLQEALERYGTALKKTPQQMQTDLWRVRDEKATAAPPFELPSAKDGTPVRLSDYHGRVLLVAFWYPG